MAIDLTVNLVYGYHDQTFLFKLFFKSWYTLSKHHPPYPLLITRSKYQIVV